MTTSLSDMFSDWGGFEEFVRDMHSTGNVTAERNVLLKGRSGAPRQIDVLITQKEGLYEHKTIVECKLWNKNVSRLHVDALSTTIREVGAAKGVIFSIKGFQKGAITQAEAEGIKLFKLRELTDEEWGLPGRVVDFWLHVIGLSIGNFQILNATTLVGFEPRNCNLEINLGKEERSSTPINLAGLPNGTLEDFLEKVARDTAKKVVEPRAIRLRDENRNDLTVRSKTAVNMALPEPIVILHAGGVLVIPAMRFDLGVEILQSRFEFDRGSNAIFVLSVEDCITKSVHTASKYQGDEFSNIKATTPSENLEDALKNGSICQVWTTGYQEFSAFSEMEYGIAKVT